MRSVDGQGVERGVRYTLLALFVTGLRRRNPGAVVNAIFALIGTYLLDFVERSFDVEFRHWQHLYVDVAMVTHAFGMLGPYDEVRWWDHLTHTLSASTLGGLVFVAARRRGRDPRPQVVGAVVSLGVLWELFEYLIHATANRLGLEPVLVFYSKADTVLDLVFNLVGAFLVLVLGDRVLDNLIRPEE